MANEYSEQMKKRPQTNFKEFYAKVPEAIKEKRLTYSGWLKFVKKLTEKEIHSLFEDINKSSQLQKEYRLWIGVE